MPSVRDVANVTYGLGYKGQ